MDLRIEDYVYYSQQEEGDRSVRYIAIKPICKIMELNYSKQYIKLIKSDLLGPMLAEAEMIDTTEKNKSMICLPLIYAIIWICNIDSKESKNSCKVMLVQKYVINFLYTNMRWHDESNITF